MMAAEERIEVRRARRRAVVRLIRALPSEDEPKTAPTPSASPPPRP